MARGVRATAPEDVATEDVATRLSLNHALGNLGGRRKSWMNTGQPPAAPTRTTSYPPARDPARGHPASNSTSPQPANVLSNLHPLPSPTAVLPSPTPSEDANLDYATSAAPPIAPTPASQSAGDVRIPSSERGNLPTARQAATAQKRPAASPPLTSKRLHVSKAPYPRPLVSTGANVAQPGSTRRVSAGHGQVAHQPFSPPFTQPSGYRIPHVPSQSPVEYPTTPLQTPLGPPHQSSIPSQSPQVRTPTAQSSPHSPTFLQEHLLQELHSFGSTHQFATLDRARFNMLEKAVRMMDWDYVMTHLIYCLLTFNPASLPDTIRKNKNATGTQMFLMDVLDNNHSLAPHTRSFFCHFPGVQLDRFRADVENFHGMMERSSHYFRLKTICNTRNIPPTIHEMADDLGIRSRQLQSMVFLSSVRRLGLKNGHLVEAREEEILHFFTAQQEQFYMGQQYVHDKRKSQEAELQMWSAIFNTQHRTFHPQNLQVAPPPVPAGQILSSHAQPPRTDQPGRGRPQLAAQQIRPPSSLPQPPNAPAPFFPPPNRNLPQQALANPVRFALHQAHLSSPPVHSKTKERLYLYLRAVAPHRLVHARDRPEKLTFTVSPEQMASMAKSLGNPRIRPADENSLMIQVRCVKWPSVEPFDEHKWATKETSWIPFSFFQANGQCLEQRKKLHHGKDLPIDLTPMVKEGENVLEVAILRSPHNVQYHSYLVGIEIIGAYSHAALFDDITKRLTPAATVKKRIKEKLCSPIADDEIAVVNSTLNVGLFDPFSYSEICKIPCRSQACDHFDCFDLETFLETRKRNGDATVPDTWKCPICNADARPHLLFVDGFMQEVRSELDKRGLLKTRAITLAEDGSWKPKAEVLEGVADHDDDDADAPPRRQSSFAQRKAPQPQPTEVIDLGDSDDE